MTEREKPYEAAETGRGEGVITIVDDITGRKRAEEERMKHREHLEQLLKERTTELPPLSPGSSMRFSETGAAAIDSCGSCCRRMAEDQPPGVRQRLGVLSSSQP